MHDRTVKNFDSSQSKGCIWLFQLTEEAVSLDIVSRLARGMSLTHLKYARMEKGEGTCLVQTKLANGCASVSKRPVRKALLLA